MSKHAVFWIRDDFRIKNNPGLSYATNNHECVSAIYIYNSSKFDQKREAQKWWISKSLTEFGKDLQKYNINLEIFNSDEINFFSKINKEKDLSVYWNKIYEPEELDIDKKLISFFEKKKINFKFFKGNVLNEFNKVNKNDGTPFKVYSPFWRNAERIYLEKVPEKNSIIKKLKKSKNFFSGSINSDKILPKKNWYKKFENYWIPSETQAETNLNQFIKNEIGNYGVDRDFPSKKGTSKLSPFIRNGQISVQNIFEKCSNIKQKNISIKKYINEIGWREFSHSLINNFPQMLKETKIKTTNYYRKD